MWVFLSGNAPHDQFEESTARGIEADPLYVRTSLTKAAAILRQVVIKGEQVYCATFLVFIELQHQPRV
jgi:hypothetical protein